MKSRIYTGWIRHRRFAPKEHHFTYPLFMMCLDLDEIGTLFKGRLLWSATRPAPARFKREDYHGPDDIPLTEAVRDTIQRRRGFRPEGRIELITHLRCFGYIFNPVSFYYCYDAEDRLQAIMAEITNTPWGERHAYVMDCRGGIGDRRSMRFDMKKDFHISPFMPMDMHYEWAFTHPAEKMAVHMVNFKDGVKTFDATMLMNCEEATAANMNRRLFTHPAMTIGVIVGIYFEALRLKLKGVPFHRHPESSEAPSALAHSVSHGGNLS